MRGPGPNYVPWTAAEDELLRSEYPAGGLAAARRALPARSAESIYQRTHRLGLSRRRRWTADDDNRLRKLWNGELSVEEIAQRLGRTDAATYYRANDLGLPVGCPEGWETVRQAAVRTGYHPDQLRHILRAFQATIRPTLSKPCSRKGAQGRYTWMIVSPREVDAVIAAWHESEPVAAAARRLGVSGEVLTNRLRRLGLEKPSPGTGGRPKARRHWRVRPEEVALAMGLSAGGTP